MPADFEDVCPALRKRARSSAETIVHGRSWLSRNVRTSFRAHHVITTSISLLATSIVSSSKPTTGQSIDGPYTFIFMHSPFCNWLQRDSRSGSTSVSRSFPEYARETARHPLHICSYRFLCCFCAPKTASALTVKSKASLVGFRGSATVSVWTSVTIGSPRI